MAKGFTGTQHLLGTAVAATAPPVTLAIWIATAGGQGRWIFQLGNPSDSHNVMGIETDVVAATNKLSAFLSNSSFNTQALTAAVLDVTGNWNHCLCTFTSTVARAIYLNGVNKGSGAANTANPTGISTTVISGRPTDFVSGIAGQAAHAAAWSRVLSDGEAQYLGLGGNPRAVPQGLVSYWKIASGESPVTDQIGSNDLTVVGAVAGTTNPAFQTFMTGGPIGNLSFTAGTPIAAINLAAGAGIFDDVSSAFTVALQQLAPPTQPTTTSSGLTATREVFVGSTTAYTAGDYMRVTAGGTPTRVLAVTATSLVVSDPQTYTTGALVYRFAVNPLNVPGLSFTGNSYGGTPTSAATNALCFFRATCSALGTAMADTDLITLAVAGGGGGGGGGLGLLLPSGMFSGGFIGG